MLAPATQSRLVTIPRAFGRRSLITIRRRRLAEPITKPRRKHAKRHCGIWESARQKVWQEPGSYRLRTRRATRQLVAEKNQTAKMKMSSDMESRNAKQIKMHSRNSGKLTQRGSEKLFTAIFPTAPIQNDHETRNFCWTALHDCSGVACADANADSNSFFDANARRFEAITASRAQQRLCVSASRASGE